MKPVSPRRRCGKRIFPATLLTQVTDDMLTVCDETFGPVIAVQRVANEGSHSQDQ